MLTRESHAFAELIEAKFNQQEKDKGEKIYHQYEARVEEGRKFDRIFLTSWIPLLGDHISSNQNECRRGYILAFVEVETGKLIKSAGLNKPAKWGTGWASKFNLKDNLQQAVEASDPYGGFLYK